MAKELIVDLGKAPAERWELTAAQIDQARQLLESYNRDLGSTEELVSMVREIGQALLPADYWAEVRSLATQLEVEPAKALLGNAYYDMIKPSIGCTAFAGDTPDGPLHARNLDWWTENRLLNETSLACRFIGAPAGEFVSIAWPGYIGVLSGMAPGRFAITLNAVLSEEPAQIALPISLQIRKVFEEARDFDEAVSHLSEAVIPTDCLLLVSGIKPGEIVVIERTPTRHAIRRPEEGRIAVANDYLLLDMETGLVQSELQATSCGRFERINSLLQRPPEKLKTCLSYLDNPQVKMTITVQQMAFHAASGRYLWRSL